MMNLVCGIMCGVKGERNRVKSFLQEKFPDTYEEEWENLTEQGHIIESEFLGDEILVGYKPNYIDTDKSQIQKVFTLTNVITDLEEKYSSFMETVFWFYDYPKEYFFNFWI